MGTYRKTSLKKSQTAALVIHHEEGYTFKVCSVIFVELTVLVSS